MKNLKITQELKNKIAKIYSFLIIGGIIFYIFFSIYYIDNLDNQIIERNVIIQNLSRYDSLFKQYMELEYDSVSQSYSYYTIKKGNKLVTYPQLSNELDSIRKEYFLLQDSVKNLNATLKLIELNYNINYNIRHYKRKGESWIERSISAPQLDSALYLFPFAKEYLDIIIKKDEYIIIRKTLPPKEK